MAYEHDRSYVCDEISYFVTFARRNKKKAIAQRIKQCTNIHTMEIAQFCLMAGVTNARITSSINHRRKYHIHTPTLTRGEWECKQTERTFRLQTDNKT